MTVTIDVKAVVSVTKVRNGWRVLKLIGSDTILVASFSEAQEAYTYAWRLEHGI